MSDETTSESNGQEEAQHAEPPAQWQAVRIGPLELQQPKPDASLEAGPRPGLAGLFERVFGRVGQELERRGWLERADLPPGWEPTHPCYPDPAAERRNAELLRRQRDLGDLDLGR